MKLQTATPAPRSLRLMAVDEKPRTLITDCLVIKHFLRKIIILHHQIRFNFSVKVNGILSTEIFGTCKRNDVLLIVACLNSDAQVGVEEGTHTLLTAHLSAILMESRSTVRDAIQTTVDHVLEQHHQAAKAHQKLQASLSVAVNSVMSVVTGSTNSSFRKTCLQALQATDTQELGTKLHKIFHDVTQHRFLHHCSCDVKQVSVK
ncbi:hypothetical protein SUZIE_160575 [Sciurus carolinensis]|uniref:Uncharacterized protein n=1 Tax=Sciurus carolinensis TaxID=30640 RepID=A0AA41MZK3_SCICA|nr:hypothetical protein [Sciurus carolinensis]